LKAKYLHIAVAVGMNFSVVFWKPSLEQVAYKNATAVAFIS